ncbi:MAG: hypothetical protein AAFV29_12560, partial [Myxococcota bacterium]
MTITVADDQGKVTQTVHLDGTKLTLQVKTSDTQSVLEQQDAQIVSRVKKGGDESKVTQTPTDVTIACKNFTVDAETIQTTSSKDTTVKVKGKTSLASDGDITLKSSAKATLQSSRDLTLKGG